MTKELVAFLRARLDEDAERAQLAFSHQADPEEGWGAEQADGYRHTTIIPHVGIIHEAIQAEHVVRWNPARVLADVDAKRRILDEYEQAVAFYAANRSVPAGEAHGLLTAIRLLTLPYAEHADYREEWQV